MFAQKQITMHKTLSLQIIIIIYHIQKHKNLDMQHGCPKSNIDTKILIS